VLSSCGLASNSPRLFRTTLGAFSLIFLAAVLSASAVAFFYPLEIETRESTVWLHVLALRQGINLYDHTQVAFINTNHGPFDPIFKLAVVSLFPFLEAWQVTRFSVFILPYVFLFVAWKILKTQLRRPFCEVAFLGSVGYLFLIVSAKEFIFVGRSDATAAILLLVLIYLSISKVPARSWSRLLRGFTCGSVGILLILTNWRVLPAVFVLFIFSLWMMTNKHHAGRDLVLYSASYLGASAAIFGLLLYQSFGFDLSLYSSHFFGVYSKASGHGHRTYGHAPAIWFLGSLLKPTSRPDSLKGGPVLLALVVYLLVPNKASVQNRAWFVLGAFVFAACTVAYYLNYYGGGSWYYIPFLIVLWFFLCTNYQAMSSSRLAAVGAALVVLVCINIETVVKPTVWRIATLSPAYEFMSRLRSLERTNTVLSEDTFFFRTAYQSELIDMGDMVSRVRMRGYFGGDFNRTVDNHFERIRKQPPDYIVTGFTESSELRSVIDLSYALVAEGPGNLTANGGQASRLFKRMDTDVP